jgi:hypothetical protein
MSRTNHGLPQEGTTAKCSGESLPEHSSGCPTDSGGGNFRLGDLTYEKEREARVEDMEFNPFQRRESIRRTPPGSPSVDATQKCGEERNPNPEGAQQSEISTPPVTESSDGEDEPEVFTPKERAPKRRKRSSPAHDKAALSDSGLEELARKVDELCIFTNTSKNVRKNVKKYAVEIQCLVFQAASQIKNSEDELKDLQKEFDDYKREQERRIESMVKETGKTQQCEYCRRLEISDLHKEKSDDTYEAFTKISDKKWLDNCYLNVTTNYEDALKVETENVLYIVPIEETTNNNGLSKRILNKYPELGDAEKIACKGGSYIEMELRSSIKIGTKLTQTLRNITTIIAQDGNENNDLSENTFDIIKEIKSKALEKKIEHLTIATSLSVEGELLRKMTEFLFHGSGVKVILKLTQENKKIHKKDRGERIVIDTEKGTYAETLMKIKVGLTREEKNSITNVRETRNGQILLKIKKDAEEVSESLRKIMSGKKLKVIKSKRKTLHILGIDPISNDADVRKAIMDTGVIERDDQLMINPLRPAKYSTQVATVFMDEEDAKRVLKFRGLRIGMSICPIKERIDLIKCYRCWAYGHKAVVCKEEDRRELCRNCTQVGHKAEKCEKNAYCPLCKKDGHVAGGGTCPAFRKALSEERKNRKNTRNSTSYK